VEVQAISSVDRYQVGDGATGPVVAQLKEGLAGVVRGACPLAHACLSASLTSLDLETGEDEATSAIEDACGAGTPDRLRKSLAGPMLHP
jgi:hypothetical protein